MCCILFVKHALNFHNWCLFDTWTTLSGWNIGSNRVCVLLRWLQLHSTQENWLVSSRDLWFILARNPNVVACNAVVSISGDNLPLQLNRWEWDWNYCQVIKSDVCMEIKETFAVQRLYIAGLSQEWNSCYSLKLLILFVYWILYSGFDCRNDNLATRSCKNSENALQQVYICMFTVE